MISLYSGTPGSGKSLHMAHDIRERLQCNNTITIGTFYINTKRVKKCRGQYIRVKQSRLTPHRLYLFSRRLSKHLGRRLREGEIVLFIDEAHRMFNSRDWQNVSRSGWNTFFSEHRHYGFDIVLCCQMDRQLDRQVRGQIEYEYIHRKVDRAGKFGKFLGIVMRGNLFVWIKKWYPIKEKVDTQFFVGNKHLYSVYDSYEIFDVS